MTDQEYEKSFVMLKPDALHRGEIGEIINRIEGAGLKISAIDIKTPDEEMARDHYGPEIAERHGEEVREGLVEYITEFPVMPMVIEGRNSVEKVRDLMGESFDPTDCSPGTIRGDLSSYSAEIADNEEVPIPNLVHGAETYEDAEREIELWFDEEEFEHYERPDFEFIRDSLGYESDGGTDLDFEEIDSLELKEEYLIQELEGGSSQEAYQAVKSSL